MTPPFRHEAEVDGVAQIRVAVIGAGRAGLAASHALLKKGFRPGDDFIVVDAAEPQHTAWKTRWHSMTFHEPARRFALPDDPMPGDPHRRPRTDEMADYLDWYRAKIGVHPRWNTTVQKIATEADGRTLSITTSAGTIRAGSIVAATGPYAIPETPAFAIRTVVPGINIHSGSYTHPRAVPPGSVLIVGGGASGREIAHELAHSHEVILSTSATHKRRWLAVAPETELPLELLRAHGVATVGRITGGSATGLHTVDGGTLTPQSVIWATGYHHGFDYLPARALGAAGEVLSRRGRTPVPGVFVLGIDHRKAAGPARVVRDAARIAHLIGKRQ